MALPRTLRAGIARYPTVWFVALLATAAVLAACGRPPVSDRVAASPSPIPSGPATGTLTMWAMGTEGLVLDQIAQDFEESNPGLDIQITPVPWGSAHDKMSTAIAANSTPDMAQMGTTWVPEFSRANGLDPTPDGLVNPADFFPGAWAATVVDDVSFGIPWYVETRLMFYRKDYVEKWNLTVPEDWTQFRAFGEALQARGVPVPMQIQSSGTGNAEGWLPFLWSAGGEVLDADMTEFTLNSPQALTAMEFTSSLFRDGIAPVTIGGKTIEQSFVDGDTASFLSGPWEINLLIDQGGQEFYDTEVGVFPMPRNVAPGSFMGGSALCVFQAAQNRDAAWKFAAYLATPAVQQRFYDLSKDLPSIASAWDYPPIKADPNLAVFGEQLKTAKAAPAIPTWEQVKSFLDSANEKVNRGVLTPQEGIDEMQQNASFVGTGLD